MGLAPCCSDCENVCWSVGFEQTRPVDWMTSRLAYTALKQSSTTVRSMMVVMVVMVVVVVMVGSSWWW